MERFVKLFSGLGFGLGMGGLLLTGCDQGSTRPDGGPDADGGLPDPAYVYQASGQLQTIVDEPFDQERPSLYRSAAQLPDLDVHCLAVYDQEVWAGTASGLVQWDPGADRFVERTLPDGPAAVLDLAGTRLADGRLALALADRLLLFDPAGLRTETITAPEPALSVASDGNRVWLGTERGVMRLEGASLVAEPGSPDLAVRDLVIQSDRLWLATAQGLVALEQGAPSVHDTASGALPDDDLRALAGLDGGGVACACASGGALVGTGADRLLPVGRGGLPTDDLTSVAAGAGGLFFGHAIGASWVESDFARRDHYHSLRWIPDQQVRAVALQGERRRWVATAGGIARIDLVPTVLSEKAALFEQLAAGHWRLDFVSDTSARTDPWELSEPLNHWDHDNDGLWTQMQVVAWSYAGAASGDPAFCERARRAMRAMMWEIDLPAVTFVAAGKARGFVARSFVRDDEGAVYDSKASQANWHLVTGWQDGHDYYWKDDTSSDETTGHFFGYPVYFDLCADEQERAVLAEYAGALAGYIIAGGLELIDLDGLKTTHGHWNPQRLAISLDGLAACMEQHPLDACAEARYGGGWLNGIEILGHLLAAWHMTGDQVFYRAYDELIRDHRYAELVDFNAEIFTVTKRNIANHSDHELAMLAYHTLIRYEPDDERRARWIRSLLAMYEWEIPERNPLWSAIIAGFAVDGYHLDEAIQTLREWPEDWREWRVDNSHRKDVTRDMADRHGDAQIKEVLPYDEIRTMKWNGNPYALANGGDGRSVQAPWPWLLPYWIYRYHGIIQ